MSLDPDLEKRARASDKKFSEEALRAVQSKTSELWTDRMERCYEEDTAIMREQWRRDDWKEVGTILAIVVFFGGIIGLTFLS